MHHIYRSFGHGLAYALFFDGAGAVLLSACDLEKSYASSQLVWSVSCKEDIFEALYAGVKDAFYGFTPSAVKYFLNPDSVNSGAKVLWIKPLVSSAIIGAYKYWTKGESAYIGAYSDVAYALATLLEQDNTFLGSVLTTGVIEGIEGLFRSAPTVEDLRKAFVINSAAGVATGALSWVLLENMHLYNQCVDNIGLILSHALSQRFISALGLGVAGYNLYQIALSKDPFNQLSLHLSGLNLLCVSALVTSAVTGVLGATIIIEVLATIELSKVSNLLSAKSCSVQDIYYC